ncbi:Aspartate aminotransferase, putative [Perkinsus marinus ATCC 50983]|uniref:Aspartate aminotransferase, putative n=1 Tax=Perkinsus marinus (strain ATCC 50983 / TXsc) TaxID=423536 RepID=C5LCL0_PERM5|nr:Aspartate aminotransferase, putative [Perkinsus marinus ATCC 50983]EER05693.1 Aspartate aminotransferase, putative [Perkinsus marinus ATCC 50983]|eukprot:XP_002773877.1 Aspartate aminotransferase, putative [Perkinsus marinus ATCC 50983]
MGSSKGSNKPIRVAFQGEKEHIVKLLCGTIHANYDLLLRYSGLVFILGEIDFPVKHCLLTRRKIDNPSKVDRAYSHPQALAQCALYLRQHNIKSIIYGDTAGAAKMLSSISINDDDEEEGISAAISSRLAADIYNLHVVDTDIQDIAFNHTRFLLLGHTPSPFVNMDNTTIPTKVSIVFRVQDTPGSMYTSLSAFSHRNLQLTKLESRPVPPAMLDDTTKYGKFAQFLCDRLTRVCGDTTTFSATNRKDGDDRWRSDHAKTLGIRYYPDMNIKAMLHHEQPDIIVIATSILSLKDVIHELSSAIKSTTTTTRRRSKKNLLIVDVCSVKEYPKELLKEAFFQNDDDDDTSYITTSLSQLLAFQSSFHKVKDMLLLEDDKDDEEEDDDNNVDDITLKTIPYSNLCDRVPSSTTVRLHAQATELKREGRDIQGALGVGEPDFKPPIEITSAIASSLTSGEGCRYSPSNGIFNLRKAIADDLRIRKGIEGIEPKNVVITASGKAAIAASFMAILNAGDEIIIPTPCWPTFPDLARMCDATPVYVQSISPQYAITAHSIASAITSKTKIIVLNSPCNPTGYVIPKDELVRIAELLQQHTGIMAVCDDLYERLVYDGDIHYTLAGVCSPIVRDRIITIGGFSKAFAMTGLRLGYAVCSDDRWIDRAIGKILGQVTGCPCTASQIGGVAALCDVSSSWHKDRLAELQYKRDTLFDRLRMIPNVICPDKPPKGAFYAMPDLGYYVNKLRHSKGDPTLGVAQLCEHLLSSHGLSIVPGDGFCTTQPVVRLSYATSIENIHDACNRLQDFLLVLEAS